MYYINKEKLFNNPHKEMKKMLAESLESPPEKIAPKVVAYSCSGLRKILFMKVLQN
jgi:hypothetical protein